MSDVLECGTAINFEAPLIQGQSFGQGKEDVFGLSDSVRSSHSFSRQYTIYNHIFNEVKETFKGCDLVHFDLVITRMRRMAMPLFGEYVEEKDNLAFLDISAVFFEYAFFNNELGVWYDTEIEEFFLYRKMNPEDKKCKKYLDIVNEVEVEFAVPSELIKVKWNGYKENRFIPGYQLAYSMEAKLKVLEIQTFLGNKRALYEIHDVKAHDKVKLEQQDLLSLDPCVTVEAIGNRVAPLVFTTGADLKDASMAIYHWFDREIAELGRVANINDKQERKTTGENYKDIHAVVCRQRLVLNQLKAFAQRCKIKGNLELSFAINGLLKKSNIPVDDEGADPVQGGDEQLSYN